MEQIFDRNHFKRFAKENEITVKQNCSQNHSEFIEGFPNIKWESSFRNIDDTELNNSYLLVGSLRDNKIKNLGIIEFNNKEGEYWSPKSKIATNFYPYHVSDVYKCKECNKLFLVYTEYGGHGTQLRIRNVKTELIVEETSSCTLKITKEKIFELLLFLKIEISKFDQILEENETVKRINTDFNNEEVFIKKIRENFFLFVAKKETIYHLIELFYTKTD